MKITEAQQNVIDALQGGKEVRRFKRHGESAGSVGRWAGIDAPTGTLEAMYDKGILVRGKWSGGTFSDEGLALVLAPEYEKAKP